MRRETDAGDGEGRSPDEAFTVLGNAIRVDILLALWDRQDLGAPPEPASFSELFGHVDVADSGQFNYHLERLVGHFVRQVEGGYELTEAGRAIVQTVVAGTGLAAPTLEPTVLDESCPFCAEPVGISYGAGRMRVYCADCEGRWTEDDATGPGGGLLWLDFPPAGLRDRSPRALLDAAITDLLTKSAALAGGVCPDCAGTVDAALELCETHTDGGGCPDCGRVSPGTTRWTCTTCKARSVGPSYASLVEHPAVVAFFHDRGVEQRDPWARVNLGIDWRETVVSTDPLRLQVTVTAGGDELRARLDETARVVSLTGEHGATSAAGD